MSKISQKEAVYNAIISVLSKNKINYVKGSDVNPLMSRTLRGQVNALLLEGFNTQSIEIDGSRSNSELKAYISGLQSNWLRKDSRLNGGGKYSAKNPGSRAGAGDPQLKALRALLSTLPTNEEKIEVQGYISARVNELQTLKTKSIPIDIASLPLELRNLVK